MYVFESTTTCCETGVEVVPTTVANDLATTGHYCLVTAVQMLCHTKVYCCQLLKTISIGCSHSFYRTEWLDSTGTSQYQWPQQGSRGPPGSWSQPQPTEQGEHRAEQDPTLIPYFWCTSFLHGFSHALWKYLPLFCFDYGATIYMYTVPLLLSIHTVCTSNTMFVSVVNILFYCACVIALCVCGYVFICIRVLN